MVGPGGTRDTYQGKLGGNLEGRQEEETGR